MDNQNVLKSSQEQAVASWINYLNQIRLNRLIESLSIENENWENATTTIKETISLKRSVHRFMYGSHNKCFYLRVNAVKHSTI